MPRMRILNTVERYDFDFPPTFNSLQRKKYFYFSDTQGSQSTHAGIRLAIAGTSGRISD